MGQLQYMGFMMLVRNNYIFNVLFLENLAYGKWKTDE